MYGVFLSKGSNLKKFRYNTNKKWFKGNTHLHSLCSDGTKTFKELTELYFSEGYNFLFRTDHWVCSDTTKDVEIFPLLWMDGIELDGIDNLGSEYHVVCLGKVNNIVKSNGFQSALESAKKQNCIRVLAHPRWMGNTIEESLRYDFDGVEVYNNSARQLNGKGDGGIYWDKMLERNQSTLSFAVDDAHFQPEQLEWNSGWIVINAGELNSSSIINAIKTGNFYSSRGPSFLKIDLQKDYLSIRTSPVKSIRLIGPGNKGINNIQLKQENCTFDSNGLITAAKFHVTEKWSYSYLEIEDEEGKNAWTNTLYT